MVSETLLKALKVISWARVCHVLLIAFPFNAAIDGLTHVFATIKVTSSIRDLPPNYHAVLEWARISLASTVFHQFVASDNSSQTFASLKRLHGLMPYFMLKAALKISNPMGMIRSVLDLFLAQPFGGRSLLQRLVVSFTSFQLV